MRERKSPLRPRPGYGAKPVSAQKPESSAQKSAQKSEKSEPEKKARKKPGPKPKEKADD